ncbi:MAG: long-chain fatty acid--CoA ligase [Haloarculaceae archaeon]
MPGSQSEPAWVQAERAYEDDLMGEGTIPELFEESAERHLDLEAQRYKGGIYRRSLVADEVVPPAATGEFHPLTYGEMREIVRYLAAGFRELGVEADDRVGIFANTRMEWAHSDLALLAAGAVVTTVYTESSPQQVRYLLDDPDAMGLVVEDEELLERVLEVEEDLDLEFFVLLEEPEVHRHREDVHTLGDVYELGEEAFDLETYRGWLEARDPTDLASLIYTSGTTGKPKGVRLTHRNFRANVDQVTKRMGPRPDKTSDDPTLDTDTVSISFLPLAHVFERLVGHFVLFGRGATVAYAEHPDTLAEDFEKIRPTMGASVPRVYERLYETIREQASESPITERIFNWAVDVAREWTETDEPGAWLKARHGIADRLVYSSVREGVGGNLEFMVSGGGSLSEDLAKVFIGMGVTVIEGYGLTETAPVVSVNPPEDIRPGTMGVPLVGVEVDLDESVVAEGQFRMAAGPVGELLVRGDNVADGYWEKPDETAASFTDDGWFRTGDLVEQTFDDYLIFRDRLKQIMVLSTGKNVAPAPIEDRFATNERIDQAMIVGDGRKFVGGLIVPNFGKLDQWAERNDVDLPPDDDAKCEDQRVREWVQEAVDEVNEDLETVETIKEFALVSREWTAENDLLTPSMKKKRRNITEAFEEKVEWIYADEAERADLAADEHDESSAESVAPGDG